MGYPKPPPPPPPASSPLRKVAIVVSTVFGLVFLLGVAAAIATPKFGASRERANTRACFANQKTIAGAIEMYRLDKQAQIDDLQTVGPALVEGGYLLNLPDDPGSGKDTFKNYSLRILKNTCENHGSKRESKCTTCSDLPWLHVQCSVHGRIE